jgi:hypothetical protein
VKEWGCPKHVVYTLRLRNGTNCFRADMDSTWSLTFDHTLSCLPALWPVVGTLNHPIATHPPLIVVISHQVRQRKRTATTNTLPHANLLTAPAGPRPLNVRIQPASLQALVRHLIGFTNRSMGRIPCVAL